MTTIATWLWNDPNMASPGLVNGCASPREPETRFDMLPSYRDRRRGRVPQRQQVVRPASRHRPVRQFSHENVITLAAAIRRQLTVPHRFVCVTDDLPADMTPRGVEWVQTPPEWRALGEHRTPEGARFPSCYRRLGGFSEKARELLGELVLTLDIDLVPVRNMDHIVVNHPQDEFVGWRPFRDWGAKLRFGGGLYLHRPGTRTEVYEEFVKNPRGAINAARAAGFRGSDQAWISYKLAHREPYYKRDSGIYSIRDLGADHALPHDACLVQFNGNDKPWTYRGRAPWVAEHWRR